METEFQAIDTDSEEDFNFSYVDSESDSDNFNIDGFIAKDTELEAIDRKIFSREWIDRDNIKTCLIFMNRVLDALCNRDIYLDSDFIRGSNLTHDDFNECWKTYGNLLKVHLACPKNFGTDVFIFLEYEDQQKIMLKYFTDLVTSLATKQKYLTVEEYCSDRLISFKEFCLICKHFRDYLLITSVFEGNESPRDGDRNPYLYASCSSSSQK